MPDLLPAAGPAPSPAPRVPAAASPSTLARRPESGRSQSGSFADVLDHAESKQEPGATAPARGAAGRRTVEQATDRKKPRHDDSPNGTVTLAVEAAMPKEIAIPEDEDVPKQVTVPTVTTAPAIDTDVPAENERDRATATNSSCAAQLCTVPAIVCAPDPHAARTSTASAEATTHDLATTAQSARVPGPTGSGVASGDTAGRGPRIDSLPLDTDHSPARGGQTGDPSAGAGAEHAAAFEPLVPADLVERDSADSNADDARLTTAHSTANAMAAQGPVRDTRPADLPPAGLERERSGAASRAVADTLLRDALASTSPGTSEQDSADRTVATGSNQNVVAASARPGVASIAAAPPIATGRARNTNAGQASLIVPSAPGAPADRAGAGPMLGHGEQGSASRDGRSPQEGSAGAHRFPAAHVPSVAITISDPAHAASAWLSRLAQAAPDTQPLTTASAAAWHLPDQIVRGLHLQVRGGIGEAVIRLTPEHLGEVVVEMKVEHDGVVATLKADTPAVRAWIAGHRDDLERGLADAGLRLDRLHVSDREPGRERQRQPAQDERPRRRGRQPAAGVPQFEVLV